MEADLSRCSLRFNSMSTYFSRVHQYDLPNGLKSNAKLFADDTSLFTIVKDKIESANILNLDQQLISNGAYKCKMLFNPDPKKTCPRSIIFKKKPIGVIVDEKLNFKEHIYSAISKVNKGISVIKKLRHRLPQKLQSLFKTSN